MTTAALIALAVYALAGLSALERSAPRRTTGRIPSRDLRR